MGKAVMRFQRDRLILIQSLEEFNSEMLILEQSLG